MPTATYQNLIFSSPSHQKGRIPNLRIHKPDLSSIFRHVQYGGCAYKSVGSGWFEPVSIGTFG